MYSQYKFGPKLITLSLTMLNMSSVMAYNNNGDHTRTPTVYFSTRSDTKESKSLGALTASLKVEKMETESPPWFWAYQGEFVNDGVFYFGLQPNGEYGKTALFSVFGKGAQSNYKWCSEGADSEDINTGISCHVAYDWKPGHKYTFRVAPTELFSETKNMKTWKGTVKDTVTGKETIIGIITVPLNWLDIKPSLVGWAEWYSGGELNCSQRTNFAVNFSEVSGEYSNSSSTWKSYISSSTPNTCATYTMTGSYPVAVVMNAGGKFESDTPVRPDEVVWEQNKIYATACTKVVYDGNTWLNGWWSRGNKPGLDGEWGVWRKEGAKNMHKICKQ